MRPLLEFKKREPKRKVMLNDYLEKYKMSKFKENSLEYLTDANIQFVISGKKPDYTKINHDKFLG